MSDIAYRLASGGAGGGSPKLVSLYITFGGIGYATFFTVHLVRVTVDWFTGRREAARKELQAIEDEYRLRRKQEQEASDDIAV